MSSLIDVRVSKRTIEIARRAGFHPPHDFKVPQVMAKSAKTPSLSSASEEAVGLAAWHAYERREFQSALELYRKAARIGRSNYWYVHMGDIYDDNLDPPDPKKAVHYYKLGARTEPRGAYNLAVHYFWTGKERWQRYWLNRAIDLGFDDAPGEFEKLQRRFKSKRNSKLSYKVPAP